MHTPTTTSAIMTPIGTALTTREPQDQAYSLGGITPAGKGGDLTFASDPDTVQPSFLWRKKRGGQCWISILAAPLPGTSEAGWVQGWSIGALTPKSREFAGDSCCSTHC